MAKEIVEDKGLIVISDVKPALVFSDREEMNTLLHMIQEKVAGFVADITTEEGRKEVASMAWRVARSKTIIDDIGKKHVENQKRAIKKVDELRKFARDYLDDLRDTVRAPLNRFEEELEKAKAAALAAATQPPAASEKSEPVVAPPSQPNLGPQDSAQTARKAEINTKLVEFFVSCGMCKENAEVVVFKISMGMIPNISITY
jgi:hypothetical protein